jgi:hypothetical protein
LREILHVSEFKAEQSGGETGSLGAGTDIPASSDASNDLIAATMQEVAAIASPRIAPDHEAPREDPPKVDGPAADPPKVDGPAAETSKANGSAADTSRVDPPKAQMPKAEPFKVEPVKAEGAGPDAPGNDSGRAEALRMPREFLIMSPGERGRESRTAEPKQEAAAHGVGKGRFAAMAAILVMGVVAGAAGGALATVGLAHFTERAAATSSRSPDAALQASVARIDADITALKAGLEQTSKASMSQSNKTIERLDRIEKAQVEPAAKLARLSEAVDKLRAAPASAAAKEPTGSVPPPAGAQALPMPQASPAAPKTEVGRLPTVDGWVLREVGHGSALIESRQGLYEVYAGDPVPGLGRVDAIRRQDGRWVVVTSKGLIVQH